MRSTGFDPVAAEGGGAAIEKIEAAADAGISQFVSREVTKLDRPELTSAHIIVSGGRGLGCGENYTKTLEPLADKLGAALGASRAVVDAGCRHEACPVAARSAFMRFSRRLFLQRGTWAHSGSECAGHFAPALI